MADSPQTTPSPLLTSTDAHPTTRKRPLPSNDEDERAPDIDSFLKQAHYGKLANELRARLSYASFKSSRNLSHMPFTSLEQQFKPKPGPSAAAVQLHEQLQQETLSPRSKQPRTMKPPQGSPGSNSLYSAILGGSPMPPSKKAKGDHSPILPFASPSSTGRSVRSSRRTKDASSAPDDISAATTLTSLLLNRPGSRSEGETLSRSSSAASVTVFTNSQLSQNASSVIRSQPSVAGPSSASSSGILGTRPKTPQPEDAQAAELMLFLATSPSPARSSHSRTRSENTRPGQLLSKARVLFGDGAPPTGSPSMLSPPTSHSLPVSTLLPPTTGHLLPPPPSPQNLRTPAFDFADYLTSPVPTNTGFTPKVSIGDGRRLFAEEPDVGNVSGPSSRPRIQSSPSNLFPSAMSPSTGNPMYGLSPASVLGPAMGANG